MEEVEEEELDEFEEQLRQEALARVAKEEGATLSKGSSYVDDDGTVMEWDHERRAYFPKIDADFIAQYQINYGAGGTQGQELSEEEKKAQYDEYWKNYYNVYTQDQPQLPKFDDEGNPVEDEEDEDGDKDTGKKKNKGGKGKQSESAEDEGNSDPTSDEHYQYNLYYFGKEYADTYRDYYRDNPDGEAVPDWVKPKQEEPVVKNKKKGKKVEEKAEKRKEPPREEGWFDIDSESSTQVYVSGLPTDITDEEFKEIMTKCGLVIFDPQTRQPKLRLYKDKEGNMKGDGLCTYIKAESVELALQILDGTEIRGHTVAVERAQFELKGEYDPKKKKKKLSNKAKQRLKERQQKLFDWRPDKNPFERGRHERIVILKNMFDIKEFEKNPGLINELRADVREECLKFGEVKKVALYDRNPEGVISVTFKEPEEADACIAALNGRWFAKNRVVALTHDGKTRYEVEETEEEKAKRLKDWENFLKGEDEGEEGGAKKDGGVVKDGDGGQKKGESSGGGGGGGEKKQIVESSEVKKESTSGSGGEQKSE